MKTETLKSWRRVIKSGKLIIEVKNVDGKILKIGETLELNDITKKYSFGTYFEDGEYFVVEQELGLSIAKATTENHAIALANSLLNIISLDGYEKLMKENKDCANSKGLKF